MAHTGESAEGSQLLAGLGPSWQILTLTFPGHFRGAEINYWGFLFNPLITLSHYHFSAGNVHSIRGRTLLLVLGASNLGGKQTPNYDAVIPESKGLKVGPFSHCTATS